MVDPWNQQPGEEVSDSNAVPAGWMRGSRSVSSSTRMERDDEGKRVVTTVTKTTVVDGEGKRRTEVVTTKKFVDEGNRVETKKVVQEQGDGSGGREGGNKSTLRRSERRAGEKSGKDKDGIANGSMPSMDDLMGGHPHHPMMPSMMAAQASGQPTSPAEVSAISTDCLLGVSISDTPTGDPDSVVSQMNKNRNNNSTANGNNNSNGRQKGEAAGWRKTEYLFRLGRFIPPFMIVNKYYQDKEEEERRRLEMQKEYNDMRDRMKKGRWDKSTAKDKSVGEEGSSTTAKGANTAKNTTIMNNDRMDAVSSRTEYYMQRLQVQMSKNLDMMCYLFTEMTKPDFPKKVQVSGTKILENMGPTVERTGKLMGDVWDMWLGAGGFDWGGGNNSEGENGRGRRR